MKKPHNKQNETKTKIRHMQKYVEKLLDKQKMSYENADYRKKISEMMENAIKGRHSYVNKYSTSYDPEEQFKINPAYNKRRIEAAIEYTTKFSQRFRKQYPELFLEETVEAMLTCPSMNVPDHMREGDIAINPRTLTLAIALFILDDLRMNGNIEEALLYLPNKRIELDEIGELPAPDSVFNDDVICGMMLLIEKRDNENDTFLNLESAKRTADSVPPRQFGKIEHKAKSYGFEPRVLSEEESDTIRKTAVGMTYRQRLDKILSLMDETTVRKAETRFEEKIFEFVSLIFDSLNEGDKKILSVLRETLENCKTMDALTNKLAKYEIEAQKKKKDIQKSIRNACISEFFNEHIPRNVMATKMTPLIMETNNIDMALNDYDKFNMLADSANENMNLIRENLLDHARTVAYALNDSCRWRKNEPKKTAKLGGNYNEITKRLNSFSIDNPYETCFGYFSLLDSGNNIVWLIEITSTILCFARNQLPWMVPPTDYTTREFETDNTVDRLPDCTETIKSFYSLDYTTYYQHYNANERRVDPESLERVNMAQLIFDGCNTIPPRYLNALSNKLDKGYAKSGVNKKTVKAVRAIMETSAAFTNKIELPYVEENLEEPEIPAEDKNLKSCISEKDNQISELRKTINRLRKEVSTERADAERVRNEAEAEHKELIELRELIYKLRNENEIEQQDENEIELPYTATHNVVIYGGHATWLKAIRGLLHNVKIIEPQVNPNVDLIRNADVVWMQTNAMPHSFYNKILDVTRQRKITVKYFAYASAEKCAKQLAEYDSNME